MSEQLLFYLNNHFWFISTQIYTKLLHNFRRHDYFFKEKNPFPKEAGQRFFRHGALFWFKIWLFIWYCILPNFLSFTLPSSQGNSTSWRWRQFNLLSSYWQHNYMHMYLYKHVCASCIWCACVSYLYLFGDGSVIHSLINRQVSYADIFK